MLEGKYMTVREAATQWGWNPTSIRKLCRDGRIPGAQNFNYDWAVPADAERPIKLREGRPHKK